MKVLVVDGPEGAQRAALLMDGFDVVTTKGEGVRAALERTAFDVVVADWPGTQMAEATHRATALVEAVRSLRAEYTAVVFMGDGSGPPAVAAFGVGADDWVERPLDGGLLKARVRRAARIAALERAGSRAPDVVAQHEESRIERLRAWRTFPMLNARTLTALFHLEFVDAAESVDFQPTFAAEIKLNAPKEHEETIVVIEMEERGLVALGEAVFGDENNVASQIDMLLEIANTLGGTFARDALQDQTELTLGLPASLSVEAASRDMKLTHTRRTVMLEHKALAARMRVSIGVHGRKNIRIPVTKIREGMVLTKDLVTSKGILLMKAGSRFSAMQTRRVIAALEASDVVEVADAVA